jgi:DNA-directed RNA polymerase subunit RPC12/RpoP
MIDYEEMRKQLSLLPDDELLDIWEAHDEEQWRPEAFDIIRSILLARGISPDKKKAEPEYDDADLDAAAFATLASVGHYNSPSDALTDQMALEGNGIKSWNSSQFSGITKASGMELRVRREDYETAMQIIGSPAPVLSSDLPEDIAEPPCPKCGSRNVMEHPVKDEQWQGAFDSAPEQLWFYRCDACGHEWNVDFVDSAEKNE